MIDQRLPHGGKQQALSSSGGMMDNQARDLITTGEVARLLGVTPRRVRQIVDAGRLAPVCVTPIGRLYLAQEVERLRRERETAKARRSQ
jgi:excisionase family DNA binding protein